MSWIFRFEAFLACSVFQKNQYINNACVCNMNSESLVSHVVCSNMAADTDDG